MLDRQRIEQKRISRVMKMQGDSQIDFYLVYAALDSKNNWHSTQLFPLNWV